MDRLYRIGMALCHYASNSMRDIRLSIDDIQSISMAGL